MKITHIIEAMSLGGGPRAVLASAKYSIKLDTSIKHQIISLRPPKNIMVQQAQQLGITIYDATKLSSENIDTLLIQSDIVQINWWNCPILNAFVHRNLPPMRLVIWFHVAGDTIPQLITDELLAFTDTALASNVYTLGIPAFRKLQQTPPDSVPRIVDWVFAGTDFESLEEMPETTSNEEYRIGYIGTVDFVKLHPDFIAMSANVEIPNVTFYVYGRSFEKDMREILQKQVRAYGIENQFKFAGFVDNVTQTLNSFDSFGYPLTNTTYASSELILQEAMYVGLAPVIFPYGGAKDLVQNKVTGFVVNTSLEYAEALKYLYKHPKERLELGKQAQAYARSHFGAANAAGKLNNTYYRMMSLTKRTRSGPYELTGTRIDPSDLFLRSLGKAGLPYHINKTSSEPSRIDATEYIISMDASKPIMRSPGFGSVFHYFDFFPNDPYLALWSGIYSKTLGRYNDAKWALSRAEEMPQTSGRARYHQLTLEGK